MPRIARVVIPGCPHHVTQRGNRREAVFFTPDDRRRYLALLAEYAAKGGLAIQAYCLMTNHVHLVAVPAAEGSLGGTLKPVHMRYSQHVNRTQGLGGRLWQGRFFSCPLDREHLWAAVRYVERNPVRAGLTDSAEAYGWSSAAAHVGLREEEVLSDPCGLTAELGPAAWRRWLREPWEDQDAALARLRLCTRTGRPAGGRRFVKRLESQLGRVLAARNPGRPKKPPPPTASRRRGKPREGR